MCDRNPSQMKIILKDVQLVRDDYFTVARIHIHQGMKDQMGKKIENLKDGTASHLILILKKFELFLFLFWAITWLAVY